jgi:HlyD family secretion protein
MVALLGGFALGGATVYFFRDRIFPSLPPNGGDGTDTGPVAGRDSIDALGRLQPSGGVIAVYGPTGDRIVQLLVKQGDKVNKGDELALLESHKDRLIEHRLAESQLKEARIQKSAIKEASKAQVALLAAEGNQSRETFKDDVKAQDAKIRALESQQRVAQAQLERMQSLDRNRAPLSAQEMDQQRLAVRKAVAELRAARAMREKTNTVFKTSTRTLAARRDSAKAEAEQALARVPEASAQQNVVLAKRRLDLTQIKAPVSGRVLRTIANVGDTTGTTAILDLAGGSGMMVVAEVYQTDIRLLRDWLAKGPVAITVKSAALKSTLRGTLTDPRRIAHMVARNTLVNLSPRADTDRRVIDVRIDLNRDSVDEAARYVGLQVDVKFTPPGGKP